MIGERERGVRPYADVDGYHVRPVMWTDGDSEGRMIIAVGVEVPLVIGDVLIGFEMRALPGSPAYRLGWWVTDWWRRREARREGAVP